MATHVDSAGVPPDRILRNGRWLVGHFSEKA
jgi:hypothetical protein